MSVVMVSDKRQPEGDIGVDARRALGFDVSIIPPGVRPAAVSIDIPACGREDARRIVAQSLDAGLPGWHKRLDLAVR